MATVKMSELLKGGKWLGKVNPQKITAMEILLNVRFPSDYKKFIAQYGSGIKNGTEIYGFHPNVIADENVLGHTIKMRNKYYEKIGHKKNYVFISEIGDGGHIFIDTNDGSVNEIYFMGNIKSRKIANSFMEWLVKKFYKK